MTPLKNKIRKDIINISVAGAAGRMGQMLVKEIKQNPETKLVSATCHHSEKQLIGKDAGTIAGIESLNVPLVIDPQSLLLSDVIIDFTTPESSIKHSNLASGLGISHVIGTTGFTEEQEEKLKGFSKKIPIVYSANMSVGVNLLIELLGDAVSKTGVDWDVEILEMHHKYKVDAPSGTALALGKAAAKARNKNLSDISKLSREGHTGARSQEEIGFAVLRGGSVVGDHKVILASGDERIELSHKAGNRSIFASGAVRAAIWSSSKEPGLYAMKDVLGFK